MWPPTGRTTPEQLFLLRDRGVDLLVAALAIVSLVRIWLQPLEPRGTVSALALMATVPLLARRRFPLGAPSCSLLVGCVGLAVVVPGALWEQLQFFFGALLSFWIIGAQNRGWRSALGLGLALAVAVFTVSTDPLHHQVGDHAFGIGITLAAWVGGRVLGVQASHRFAAEGQVARLTAERERRAAEAVAAERARIARELHDVIAHSVSVMVVQAGAAQEVLGEGNEQLRTALDAIRQSGKGALVELRYLLGLLRDDVPGRLVPGPGLAQLDELFAHVEAAGVTVVTGICGTPRQLSPGLDQTAYRIVQEALTNTMKHAAATRARVSFEWAHDVVIVTVTDDGRTSGRVSGTEIDTGHGIVGMQERARIFGGELEAGSQPDGGFRVHARLPG